MVLETRQAEDEDNYEDEDYEAEARSNWIDGHDLTVGTLKDLANMLNNLNYRNYYLGKKQRDDLDKISTELNRMVRELTNS